MYQTKHYENLKIFSNDQADLIQKLAQALDADDILDAWCTTLKDLESDTDRDKTEDYAFFMDNYRKGRLDGKTKAVNSIMDKVADGKANEALAYLKNFTNSWKEQNADGMPIGLKILLDPGPASSEGG